MVTLREFIHKKGLVDGNKNEFGSALTHLGCGIVAVVRQSVEFTGSEAREFSEKVTNLIESHEFIEPLSKEIGAPRAEENEEEFVARAKSTMRALLRKKLG